MSLQTDQRLKQIWHGAFILTIAGIITKLLSAVYRIPYQNLAGNIGFYIYQQVYPFYGIALVLSTYGFPIIISKMLAERFEEGDEAGATKIIRISFAFFLFVGILCFSLLYFGAKQIAFFMGDIQLAPLFEIISFSFLLLPMTSLLRGYFQGKNNMKPTAVSQVVEQFVRVATIIASTYLLLANGYNVYQVGAGAVFGSLTGGVCAIIVLGTFWWKVEHRHSINAKGASTVHTKWIIKTITIEGMMICISGMLLIFIQLVDALTLYSLLVSNGVEETTAKIIKGIYDRGQPLIQLGTVVATALSLSLVPLISSARVRHAYTLIEEKVNLALRVSIVVGIGASVGLAFIMKPTNVMLFKDTSGTSILMLLAFSIMFTSLILTISSILQGLSHVMAPAIVTIIGLAVKWGLNYYLIPVFQTIGAVVASLIAYLVIALILWLYLRSKQKVNLNIFTLFGKVGIAAVLMMLALFVFLTFTNNLFIDLQANRFIATVQALSGVALGGVVYTFTILKANIFAKDELSLIPFGHHLIRFVEK